MADWNRRFYRYGKPGYVITETPLPPSGVDRRHRFHRRRRRVGHLLATPAAAGLRYCAGPPGRYRKRRAGHRAAGCHRTRQRRRPRLRRSQIAEGQAGRSRHQRATDRRHRRSATAQRSAQRRGGAERSQSQYVSQTGLAETGGVAFQTPAPHAERRSQFAGRLRNRRSLTRHHSRRSAGAQCAVGAIADRSRQEKNRSGLYPRGRADGRHRHRRGDAAGANGQLQPKRADHRQTGAVGYDDHQGADLRSRHHPHFTGAKGVLHDFLRSG